MSHFRSAYFRTWFIFILDSIDILNKPDIYRWISNVMNLILTPSYILFKILWFWHLAKFQILWFWHFTPEDDEDKTHTQKINTIWNAMSCEIMIQFTESLQMTCRIWFFRWHSDSTLTLQLLNGLQLPFSFVRVCKLYFQPRGLPHTNYPRTSLYIQNFMKKGH